MPHTATIDRNKVRALMQAEQQRFAEQHPRSQSLYQRAQHSLLAGVPMHWMTRWPGASPSLWPRPGVPLSAMWTGTNTSTSAWATPGP